MASSNAAAFARKMHRTATFIERGEQQTVRDMGFAAKDAFNDAFRSGTGITPGGNSLRMGAYFNQRAGVALVAYRGPVHWWQGGTLGHQVTPRGRGGRSSQYSGGRFRGTRSGRSRAGGARALRTPDGPRARAYPRGMRARPFFRDAKKRASQVAPQVAQELLHKNIRRAGFGF